MSKVNSPRSAHLFGWRWPNAADINHEGPVLFSTPLRSSPVAATWLLMAKQPGGLIAVLLEILYSLLDTALETMRSHPTAIAGPIGVRPTHPETPGRTVLGHGTTQVGVVLQVLAVAGSFATR